MVDTNVFVAAAFNRHSAAARLVTHLRSGRHLLVWNDRTRRETQAILSRIPRIEWEDFAPLFRDEGYHGGETDIRDFQAIEDPDDRKFAALGAATGCTLVTNDHHLLDHRESLPVDMKTPREFDET